MSELSINSTQASNMTDNVEDYEIETKSTDGISGTDETEYVNTNFTRWFGIYKNIPEVKIAMDMRAIWTVGKEIETDNPRTQLILEQISGCGIDTFRDILKNMIVMRRVGGDAFAEIIRDPDTNVLMNIKPLDPASIRIIFNNKGKIIRYEQISKNPNQKGVVKFKPEEIFHLTNKRVADEIHGVSDIEALEKIINANAESFDDMKKLMHRFVKPMFKFILDTDDTTKIDELVTKFDAAVNKGENIYIPKGNVEQELIAVPANASLNPLPWREHLRNYFFQVVGIPQIIMGSSGEFTESTAKIAYLAFEQSVEDEQNNIEAQIWNQLGLRIELSFPASLRNEMLSDEAKDGEQGQMNIQPNEVTAGSGR